MPHSWNPGARFLALLMALLVPGTASAASQGPIGAVSAGSVTIRASVGAHVKISTVEDIEFAVTDSSRPLRPSRDLCLHSNSRTGSFTISAAGGGSGGSLELSDGQRSVGYSVEWSSPGGGFSGAQRLAPASLSVGAAGTGTECRAGAGLARLTAAVDRIPMDASGSEKPFAGILMLTVSPQ